MCGLEALLVHGMKGSFIGKISSAVFGGGVASGSSDAASLAPTAPASTSRLPEPNFWMFVLVFSHRDTIQRIEKLPQVMEVFHANFVRCKILTFKLAH